MRVSDFIEYLKYGDTSNLTLVHNLRLGDVEEIQEAQRAVISYLNIGLQELHSVFNLKVGVEVVPASDAKVIQLKNNDIIHVTEVTDSNGEQLVFEHTKNVDYDIRTLAFKTYMLKEVQEGDLYFMYQSTCAPITSIGCEIDLPPAFTQAIIYYVAMRAYASVGGATKEDHSIFQSRYRYAVEDLKTLGYAHLTELTYNNVTDTGMV